MASTGRCRHQWPRRARCSPLQLRDMKLENRIVVSPMAIQGRRRLPDRLAFRALRRTRQGRRRAGLSRSPPRAGLLGRLGLYAPEHEYVEAAHGFVHAETEAKICCQIGHSGRRLDPARRNGRAAERAIGTSSRPPRSRGPRTTPSRAATREDMGKSAMNSSKPPAWPTAPICHGRTARGARLSDLVVHLAAVEPARG